MTTIFRDERRDLFGDSQMVDPVTFNNCCQILIDEIEDYTKILLGANDEVKYREALRCYDECLKDIDFERIPESFTSFEVPDWLNEDKALQISKELTDFQ